MSYADSLEQILIRRPTPAAAATAFAALEELARDRDFSVTRVLATALAVSLGYEAAVLRIRQVTDPAGLLDEPGIPPLLRIYLLQALPRFLIEHPKRCETVAREVQTERVPESRQIEPPAEVVGPALEHMRYLDESSALWSMYEEVLTKSVDRDRGATIHPSFTHIIAQLSRDEAWILYRLRERSFKIEDELDLDRAENRFRDRRILKSELPIDELYLPDKVELLYSHLESLNLVTWPVEKQTPLKDSSGVQTGIRRYSTMMLTDFGRLFVSACIPEKGFDQHAKR
jgi:hypothetical protein